MKIEDLCKLPCSIFNNIKGFSIKKITIGCSDSNVYKIYNEIEIKYLKIAKEGSLIKEYNALLWLQNKLPVPEIICFEKLNSIEFLLTKSLKGVMICSDKLLIKPENAIDLLAAGFEKIYKVDISDCPFNVGLDYKLNLVKNNIKQGLINEEFISEDILNKYNGINGLYNYLNENRFIEKLCFSHGDASLPNIFVDEKEFIGFIDVGECGVADIWFDLAICEKSIKKNFGEEYVSMFYKKIDVIPDRKKIEYYLLLMNLYI